MRGLEVTIAWVAAAIAAQSAPLPRFTPPPGAETPEVREAVDAVERTLVTGRTVSDVLSDPALMSLHPWPRFRSAIRQHATGHRALIAGPREPGTPLVLAGQVLDRGGRPAGRVKVYAYQTSARGWYSDRAPHVSGVEGDRRHARLFGYVTTDDAGRFELRTVRPEGYPESDLPAHIHLEVFAGGGPALITEVQFDDDPRLTPRMRSRSRSEGSVIAPVARSLDGVGRVEVEFRLR
jgi:protocatechuate 3,4-dioxygenase beta subunit